MEETEVFAAVGEEGFTKLVTAFYRRVPTDDLLGPMYPMEDMEGAEQRLRDYLIYRFGGSEKYIQERGHPRLRVRHFPFPITIAARNRWMEFMDAAFQEAAFPPEAEQAVRAFFDQMSTFMVNRLDEQGAQQQ